VREREAESSRLKAERNKDADGTDKIRSVDFAVTGMDIVEKMENQLSPFIPQSFSLEL